ncbi:hypothetical protein DW1_1153 [Proteiniborus sp. DW1]|uniref:holin n=1 Tax=Proteiniborus sp. DW1 TaxID=1889883 RepID=UPI00092E0173|nr:holin [Proteiniborus sp. DW1]SCG82726.1 hypothetical protein DW1_1153 [Proteiniborus sp. DW1]
MLDFLSNEYLTLVLVPILIGILEVIKRTELFNKKFIPVASLVLGILFGIAFTGLNVKDGIIAGLFIGLSAVGLYSGTTNVIEGIKAKE